MGLTGARFGGAAGRRRRSEPGEDAVATRRAGPSVGAAGARVSPLLKRWRQKSAEPDPVESTPADPADVVPGDSAPGESPPEITSPVAEPSSVDGAEWVGWSDWEAVRDSDGLVRPYFLTGGRTAPCYELSFETLISATGQPVDHTAPPEHHTILTMCGDPRSVAELAALLAMPLGVARVVLGDMAEAGSIAVHRTAGSADAAPDLDLMQRVLNGLQRL